jgi:hypothetical protein
MENIIFTNEVSKAIIEILENNKGNINYVFKFLKKCLKKNILIPSSFVQSYTDLHSKLRKDESYLDVLLQLVAKYDQVDYQSLLDKLPKYLSGNADAYSPLLSILSHRNLNFSSVLPFLLDHTTEGPQVYKSV